MPEEEADRFEEIVEIGVAGSKEESIMTQVLGRILVPTHNVVPGDLGTTVAAEIEDEVFKYFRDVRKGKQAVINDTSKGQPKDVVDIKAESIRNGSEEK